FHVVKVEWDNSAHVPIRALLLRDAEPGQGPPVVQVRGSVTEPGQELQSRCTSRAEHPNANAHPPACRGGGRGREEQMLSSDEAAVLAESEESLQEPVMRGAEACVDYRLPQNVNDKGSTWEAAHSTHGTRGEEAVERGRVGGSPPRPLPPGVGVPRRWQWALGRLKRHRTGLRGGPGSGCQAGEGEGEGWPRDLAGGLGLEGRATTRTRAGRREQGRKTGAFPGEAADVIKSGPPELGGSCRTTRWEGVKENTRHDAGVTAGGLAMTAAWDVGCAFSVSRPASSTMTAPG
ncbi:hypothetical protein P7K49_026008, partial [Saguinus oedipus]